MSRALALSPLLLATALVAGASAGCGGARPEPQAGGDQPLLPAYDAWAQQVFDDGIDPAAVGLTFESPSPRGDRLLHERAKTADVVSRVRVSTVTVDSIGDASTSSGCTRRATPSASAARRSSSRATSTWSRCTRAA